MKGNIIKLHEFSTNNTLLINADIVMACDITINNGQKKTRIIFNEKFDTRMYMYINETPEKVYSYICKTNKDNRYMILHEVDGNSPLLINFSNVAMIGTSNKGTMVYMRKNLYIRDNTAMTPACVHESVSEIEKKFL